MNEWDRDVLSNCFYHAEYQRLSQKLETGLYCLQHSQAHGYYLRKAHFNGDQLINFYDPNTNLVIDEIERFWNSKSRFDRMGLPWKRGFLLWGPPGGGKTALCRRVADWIVERDGIIFVSRSVDEARHAIKVLRYVEPNRPVLNVMEEIDDFDEAELKDLLDGTMQNNNIIHIGTTNYLEDLEESIKNRPSRFDRVLFVGFPCEELRRNYLIEKSFRLKKDSTDLAKWVNVTEGMTLAHIKELLIAVEAMELDFDEALKRITGLWTEDKNETARKYSKAMKQTPKAAVDFLEKQAKEVEDISNKFVVGKSV